VTISAKRILATPHPSGGPTIHTIEARYPRFIHAELMTHRVFSRNASSSRAIPVERTIRTILEDPAVPEFWGKNQPGMQAHEEHFQPISGNIISHRALSREEAWLQGRDTMIEIARAYMEAGYHKQIVNRLLEPWSHIIVVITATEWDNFFALRCHPDAQPEMRMLAEAIREEYNRPIEHNSPDFAHLPYVELEETRQGHTLAQLELVSTARCARVSYRTHDGAKPDYHKDIELAQKLWSSKHLSPFEHQATPSTAMPQASFFNLHGWKSQRYKLEQSQI
jgi:thymidylate synthase ThyX